MALSLTEEVISGRLKDVLLPRFDSAEFRLSETGACPRLRVLRAQGYEEAPNTEEDARYFERGHVAEAWVISQYKRRYPRRTRTQVKVYTPFGDVGHIDLWVPFARKVVEVKSVSRSVFDNTSLLPREKDMLQVQAYLHFFRERDRYASIRSDNAELAYIDMDTFRVVVYPVKRISWLGCDIYKQLKELHKHVEAGTLPPVTYYPDEEPCLIYTPSGAKRCSFWEHCHIEDDLGLTFIADGPEGFGELASDYMELKREIDDRKKQSETVIKELEEALAKLRERLELGLDRLKADEMNAGPFRVKRTWVDGRASWDVMRAFEAGIIDDNVLSQLSAYKRVGKGYFRFTVAEKRREKGANANE